MVVGQLGFRQSLVERVLSFVLDEIFSTNDHIEEAASVNSLLATKLNAMLTVIFTSSQDEILFEQLDSPQRRQIVEAATSKFKLAFSQGSGPIKAKNLIQMYLHANVYSKRDAAGCRASLNAYLETAIGCKWADLKVVLVAALVDQLVLTNPEKLGKR